MPGRRPDRVQHLDQPLERHVLARLRGQHGLPHPVQQLGERRVAGQVGAQHQRVHEEPDQVVIASSVRPATGAPSGMSVPAPIRDSSAARPAVQHHEDRGLVLARQLGQRRVQAGVRELPPHDPATMGRLSGPRPVGWQRQLVGQPGQRLPPVLRSARRARCPPRPAPSRSRCQSV